MDGTRTKQYKNFWGKLYRPLDFLIHPLKEVKENGTEKSNKSGIAYTTAGRV